MSYDNTLRDYHRKKRRERVEKYGKRAVEAWEEDQRSWKLRWVNWKNCESGRLREEAEGAQPSEKPEVQSIEYWAKQYPKRKAAKKARKKK